MEQMKEEWKNPPSQPNQPKQSRRSALINIISKSPMHREEASLLLLRSVYFLSRWQEPLAGESHTETHTEANAPAGLHLQRENKQLALLLPLMFFHVVN